MSAVVILNSTVYGIDLPQKSLLRKPLDFGEQPELAGKRWNSAFIDASPVSAYLGILQSELISRNSVAHVILKEFSGEKDAESAELYNKISSSSSYADRLKIIDESRNYARIVEVIKKTGEKSKLDGRLKEVLSRESFDAETIERDLETIVLVYILHKRYFDFHPDLNPVENVRIKLTRDLILRVIRDLYNPFYERQGFLVCDFFSGKSVTLLPREETEKIGYGPGQEEQYVVGIDAFDLPWSRVSTDTNIGVIRGDVFNLAIPASTVNAVTMFNPAIFTDRGDVDRTLEAAEKILKPGGWVYIGIHSAETKRYNYKEHTEWFLEAAKKQGFSKIENLPYPENFPVPPWGKPASLIKMQKPGAIQDRVRNKELAGLRGTLARSMKSLGLNEKDIDSIIESIRDKGVLYIDDEGQLKGSRDILKLMAGINNISRGEMLRDSLFHERIHDLLNLILFKEPKRLFLEKLGRQLGGGYSFKSQNLKEDVKGIMEESFGKFDSESGLLEELIAKYYTYRFCGKDADIFGLPEMKRAGSIIESAMEEQSIAAIDGKKKDLNTLFSIDGNNTKEAQIAKLKELSKEAAAWGGRLKIEFERTETVLRLNKALGQMFLEKYPVITVLRRMRHGGSVYDFNAGISTIGFLELIAEKNEPDLKEAFENLYSELITEHKRAADLSYEVPKGIRIEETSNQISIWGNKLAKALAVFKGFQSRFNGLEKQIPYDSFNEETREDVRDYVERFKGSLQNRLNILKEGSDLINGNVQKEKADLNEIIKEIKAASPVPIKFKEINVPDIPANRRMLRQIMTNIIVNAEKLQTEKEITEIAINVRLSEDGKNIILEIVDNGVGFPEEMLSKTPGQDGSYEVIFSLDTTYRESGTGFGLAENDYYARLHNGSFRVVSRVSGEHRGSTFTIELPIQAPAKYASNESIASIINRMVDSIHTLMEKWQRYSDNADSLESENRPLFTAETILRVYFREDKMSNILTNISTSLRLYGRGRIPLNTALIEEKLDACDKIIERFDNTKIGRLRDDEEINNDYIEYLLAPGHERVNVWKITKDDIESTNTLKPEIIRSIIQRYIDDLKTTIPDLKKDYYELKAMLMDKNRLETQTNSIKRNVRTNI